MFLSAPLIQTILNKVENVPPPLSSFSQQPNLKWARGAVERGGTSDISWYGIKWTHINIPTLCGFPGRFKSANRKTREKKTISNPYCVCDVRLKYIISFMFMVSKAYWYNIYICRSFVKLAFLQKVNISFCKYKSEMRQEL